MTLIRPILLRALTVAFLTACAVPVLAITCDECQEIGSQKAAIQQEIAQKEQEIKAAFEQKKYQAVGDINKLVTDLRRNFSDLQKKEPGCKDACKPDVVKESECNRLRAEILKLEEPSSEEAPGEQLDTLYRDLSKCHKDLAQMKKTP
jgi:hypothetical protein